MYQVRLAGGREGPQEQLVARCSPVEYLGASISSTSREGWVPHLSWWPWILGPCWGTTTTSRSPNLESVAKVGASSLTWG